VLIGTLVSNRGRPRGHRTRNEPEHLVQQHGDVGVAALDGVTVL
jgi:hypothetical protein